MGLGCTNGDITNTNTGTIAAGQVEMKTGQEASNSGKIYSDTTLKILAKTVNNDKGLIESKSDTQIYGEQGVSNCGGTIIQIGNASSLQISTYAGDINNQDGNIMSNAKTLYVVTGPEGGINNTKGTILHYGTGATYLTASTGNFDNTNGTIISEAPFTYMIVGMIDKSANDESGTKGVLINNGGIIQGSNLLVHVKNKLDNRKGTIFDKNGLQINTWQFDNTGGEINAQSKLNLGVNNPTIADSNGRLDNFVGINTPQINVYRFNTEYTTVPQNNNLSKVYFSISPLDTKILDGTLANFSFKHAALEGLSWVPNPIISSAATAIDMKLYDSEGNIKAAKGKALELIATATGTKLLSKAGQIAGNVGRIVGKGLGNPIIAGKNFKEHFLNHKKLLEDLLGTKYPKLTDGSRFLEDIGKIIDNGTVNLVGRGTIIKGGDILNVYRGNGVTVLTKLNGEFVTLLKSGEGMDLKILFIN